VSTRSGEPRPRSLVYATEIDVLPSDRAVERRDGYLTVRSPGNPAHYWGNLLLFDVPPGEGDAQRWEHLFEQEFGDEPRVRHQTFAWDCTDGSAGRAREEFVPRGYDLDEVIGLVAERDQLKDHARANPEVIVRPLDPTPGADAELWAAVVELQVASREEGHGEEDYRVFTLARLADLRVHFQAGRGAWYVALDPSNGDVAASCGIVVTAGRGRFQVVDTALAYRRQGISSRLLVEAARCSADAHGAQRFVIVADANYHALGLYESLGFVRQERVVGVCRWPRGPEPS
jgi:ribosomal protein S18 acetylase RimI-like enzyme